jgi:hypothetical protein
VTLATIGAMAISGHAAGPEGSQRAHPGRADSIGQKSKDLYEAVRSLRPNFLSPLTTRTQGAQSRALPKPVVYIDGALSGELEVLHSIMVENVEEVRFKSPSEAGVELGPNAPGGAILVTLHKEPRP